MMDSAGTGRRSKSTTPQYGRRAESNANRDSDLQGAGGAAAALGIGGHWDKDTFPKNYHARPVNRAPPDAGQMLDNARHDGNIPAVGEWTLRFAAVSIASYGTRWTLTAGIRVQERCCSRLSASWHRSSKN